MSILFLRVGVDRGCGGTLSPRFEDGTFEYVPIPESRAVAEGRGVKYSQLTSRCGPRLASYVKTDQYAHYDPEFETFTYGEPSEPKRSQLLRLMTGDLLVFYAGFQGEGIERGTCFVIGFFEVAQVHKVIVEDEWPPISLTHLHQNAHFRRQYAEPTLVVVEGRSSGSQFLRIGKQLSDGKQRVLPSVAELIGFNGSVMRAVGRWVPESHEAATVRWLTEPHI